MLKNENIIWEEWLHPRLHHHHHSDICYSWCLKTLHHNLPMFEMVTIWCPAVWRVPNTASVTILSVFMFPYDTPHSYQQRSSIFSSIPFSLTSLFPHLSKVNRQFALRIYPIQFLFFLFTTSSCGLFSLILWAPLYHPPCSFHPPPSPHFQYLEAIYLFSSSF